MESEIEKEIRRRCQPIALVKMPDYSKDPFVMKKVQEATEFLQKHGLPERSDKKS